MGFQDTLKSDPSEVKKQDGQGQMQRVSKWQECQRRPRGQKKWQEQQQQQQEQAANSTD
jgi:hypothetical protein